MNITRIETPMFEIDGTQYNEYEVRNLMADVACKVVVLTEPLLITQVDTKEESYMRLDGILTDDLSGFGYASLLVWCIGVVVNCAD